MVAVTQTLTNISVIGINNHSRIFISAALIGLTLSEFEIWGTPESNKNPVRLYSESEEYLNPDGLLVGTSGDLTIMTELDSPWFILDVACIDTLYLKAAVGLSGDSDIVVAYRTIA